MGGLARFAIEMPAVFGLIVTFVSVLLSMAAHTLSYPLGALLSRDAWGRHAGEAVCRLGATLPLVWLLWRLDWLGAAGLGRLGGWRIWLAALCLLIYQVVVAVYVYTGDLRFGFPGRRVVGAVTLNMFAVGLYEEIAFRGIVFYGLVRRWGDSRWGVVGSVLVSSLLFGAVHLVNLLAGKATWRTLQQCLSAFLGGSVYAALVLGGGTIWPAIVVHGLVNAAVNVKVVNVPDYQEPRLAGAQEALLKLPVVFYALYLLWRLGSKPWAPTI